MIQIISSSRSAGLSVTATLRIFIAMIFATLLVVIITIVVFSNLNVATPSVSQNLPEITVRGYAGGEVAWSEFSFNCGKKNISFKSWTHKVELPGECPKDNKGLIGALEKLLKQAKRLKLDTLYKELDVWISHLKGG